MILPYQSHTLSRKFKNARLPCGWAFVLIGYICFIIGLSIMAFLKLPQDSYFSENSEEFIGESAKYELSKLVSAGDRVVGSNANEVVTVNYLTQKIQSILNPANIESVALYEHELDVQVASGAYERVGTPNFYDSVQNVIVKLTPKNSNRTNALLINSHFDSVVTSPGAGDDGSMVAVMLEVLSSLMKSKEDVRHPIIFLFNGDEENGLEASHAFITQHKWAKNVKTFINLDAMGIGGKEILFQSGPRNSWLLKYYSNAAKHPFASVLGEEIFEMNILPSDTDFRIFRDYGKLAGLDFAYISNGYAYHTRLDKFSNIEEGTLQHTGDNILSLVKALANAEELDDSYKFEQTGKAVYFDVLGVFFIHYSENVGIVINCVIPILSIVAIGASIWLISDSTDAYIVSVAVQFVFTLLIQVVSVAVGAAVVIALAYFIDWIDYSMSWFAEPWLIFGLYFCPFLFVAGIIPTVLLDCKYFRRLPMKFSVMLFLHAQCVIFVALIFFLMTLQYRSTFLITHVVMFYLLATMINFIPLLHRAANMWLLPVIIGQSIPLVFNSYILQILYTVLVPVSGRSSSNPEIMIAYCAIAFALLLFGFFLPIVGIFRYAKAILTILLVVFLVNFIFMLSPIGFPYTLVTPQRHIVIHTARARHNLEGRIVAQDTIFAAYFADRHSEGTIKDIAKTYKGRYFTVENDSPALRCYGPKYGLFQTDVLNIPNRSKVSLLSKEESPETRGAHRFLFEIDGAAKKYTIRVAPMQNNVLVDWSFKVSSEQVVEPRIEYRANLQFGKSTPPYQFWVTVKVNNSSAAAMDVSIYAEYIDETNEVSEKIREFLWSFPIWTNAVGIIASYDVYEF